MQAPRSTATKLTSIAWHPLKKKRGGGGRHLLRGKHQTLPQARLPAHQAPKDGANRKTGGKDSGNPLRGRGQVQTGDSSGSQIASCIFMLLLFLQKVHIEDDLMCCLRLLFLCTPLVLIETRQKFHHQGCFSWDRGAREGKGFTCCLCTCEGNWSPHPQRKEYQIWAFAGSCLNNPF